MAVVRRGQRCRQLVSYDVLKLLVLDWPISV